MSTNGDGPASREPRGGDLRVARAAGREVAPHERHTLDDEPPELASLPGPQGLGQGEIAARSAHAAEGDVRRERTRLARRTSASVPRPTPAQITRARVGVGNAPSPATFASNAASPDAARLSAATSSGVRTART